MIELPAFVVVVLGIFATIGLVRVLGRLTPPLGRRRVILDMASVNNHRHLLMAALTNQSHREGDPEF